MHGDELERIFVKNYADITGFYALNITFNGEKKVIVVDDYVPVHKKDPDVPIFMSSGTKNVWGILLEKAWAKCCGSYEAIVDGHPIDAYSFLTPYPTKGYENSKITPGGKEELLWEKILLSLKQKHFLNCTTLTPISQEVEFKHMKIKSKGLNLNHAYCILSVF